MNFWSVRAEIKPLVQFSCHVEYGFRKLKILLQDAL